MSVDVDGEANVVISGLSTTSAVGSVTVHHNEKFNVDGVSCTGSVGSVTIIAKANVTPISLVATTGTPSGLVWGTIDDAQDPSWSTVTDTNDPDWEQVA